MVNMKLQKFSNSYHYQAPLPSLNPYYSFYLINCPPFHFVDSSPTKQQIERESFNKLDITNQLKNQDELLKKEEQEQLEKKSQCNSQKSYRKIRTNKKIVKDKKKKTKTQSVFRNILPNIIHQIVIFIQKKSKSEKLVQTILNIPSDKPNWSINRFYLYQRLIKEKTSHYMNEQILIQYKKVQQIECELFSFDQQLEYLRVSRILVKYFVKSMIRTGILTSSRMKPEIKDGHLSMLRFIQQKISQIFTSQTQ